MDTLKKTKGKIVAICISERKHTKKNPVEKCFIKKDFGLEGDSHAGFGDRQVSLLARESVRKMEREYFKLAPGVFGENLLTEGVDFSVLRVGKKIHIGKSVVLEITIKGKVCTTPCSIYKSVGFCVMPTEGIFTKVIEGGEVKKGDFLEIL